MFNLAICISVIHTVIVVFFQISPSCASFRPISYNYLQNKFYCDQIQDTLSKLNTFMQILHRFHVCKLNRSQCCYFLIHFLPTDYISKKNESGCFDLVNIYCAWFWYFIQTILNCPKLKRDAFIVFLVRTKCVLISNTPLCKINV